MPPTPFARRRVASAAGSARAGKRRAKVPVIIAVATSLLVLLGFGIGAYAAIGDNDGPGVLLGSGVLPDAIEGAAPDATGEADHEGREAGGSDGGVPRGGADEAAPNPSPSPAPSPSPDDPPATDPSLPPLPAPDDPTDPMSAAYNPYVTPGDPAFVDDDARRAWLGLQTVIRECMGELGLSYLEWQWWFGGSPMPPVLAPEVEAQWMDALRGGETGGCEGVASRAADEAAAAGEPLTADLLPMPDGPTPRQRWLEFQDAVRECMAAAGHEYRYWEYWNPAFVGDDGPAAMPPGLDEGARAEWNTAAFGADDGGDGSLDSGGCWTSGARATAYTEFG